MSEIRLLDRRSRGMNNLLAGVRLYRLRAPCPQLELNPRQLADEPALNEPAASVSAVAAVVDCDKGQSGGDCVSGVADGGGQSAPDEGSSVQRGDLDGSGLQRTCTRR